MTPPATCPQCRGELVTVARDLRGHARADCRQCGGRWCTLDEAIDAGYLAGYLRERALGGTGLAPCPRCADTRLVPVSATAPVAMRPLACPRCRHVFLPQATRVAIRPELAGRDELPAIEIDQHATRRGGTSTTMRAVLDIENHPLVMAAVVPPVLGFFAVLGASGVGVFLHMMTIGMWAHEVGHALASLLVGVWAVPLPFVTFSLGTQSGSALVVVGLGLAWFAWTALRDRLVARGLLALLLLLPWLVLGLGGDDDARTEWIVYMGVGGEFVLGALLMLAFFHRLDTRPAWDLVRYACLVAGAAVFMPSWMFWSAVEIGAQPIPWGSAIGGGEDTGGDLNRLVAMGWPIESLIASFMDLARACLALIGVHWVWAAVRGWMDRDGLVAAWRELGHRR